MKFAIILILSIICISFARHARSSLRKRIKLEPKEFKCLEKSSYETPKNEDGSGSIYYLDRHDVMCGGNEALNMFKLVRNGRNINYYFKCVKSENYITNTCQTLNTPINDTNGNDRKSTDYLDRHNMDCGDKVIRGFRLKRSNNKIFYSYQCCAAAARSNNPFSTQYTDKGDSSIYNLTLQEVDAGEFNVFSKIKLETNAGSYRYVGAISNL